MNNRRKRGEGLSYNEMEGVEKFNRRAPLHSKTEDDEFQGYDEDEANEEFDEDETNEEFDEDETNEEIDDEEQSDELFILEETQKRQAKLAKGWYKAIIGKITAAIRDGNDGSKWVRVTIPFVIEDSGKQIIVSYFASKSMLPDSRLNVMVSSILGQPPQPGFDIRKLEGVKVRVQIGHNTDRNENVWEEAVTAKKIA